MALWIQIQRGADALGASTASALWHSDRSAGIHHEPHLALGPEIGEDIGESPFFPIGGFTPATRSASAVENVTMGCALPQVFTLC